MSHGAGGGVSTWFLRLVGKRRSGGTATFRDFGTAGACQSAKSGQKASFHYTETDAHVNSHFSGRFVFLEELVYPSNSAHLGQNGLS